MQYPSVSSALKEHLPRLDVIRAIAILLVFAFHFSIQDPRFRVGWNGSYLDFTQWPFYSYPLLWINWGDMGVALFFVLSGFCIHLSFLHQSKPFMIKDFFWRRFLRIYPAYFISLVICIALMHWLPSKYKNVYQIPPHLFLVHNLNKSTFMGINAVYWSLGVEFQFYLLYPLLLKWRSRMGLGGCLLIALGLNILLYLYFSFTRTVYDSPVSSTWSFPLVTWCDWILGACLAEAFVEGRSVFRHNKFFLVLSFLFLVLSLNYKPLSVQSFLFASVFFSVIIERYLSWKQKLSLPERLLIPIGITSYSLYLWHNPIISLIGQFGAWLKVPINPLTENFIYLPAVIVVLIPIVTASYFYVELGIPRWIKNRQTTLVKTEKHLTSFPPTH